MLAHRALVMTISCYGALEIVVVVVVVVVNALHVMTIVDVSEVALLRVYVQ